MRSSNKPFRPRPTRVVIGHAPRDPADRIAHRVGVLERLEALHNDHIIRLVNDIPKATARGMSRAQREALIAWLRWKEHLYRNPRVVEVIMLEAARACLGDKATVTAERLPWMMRPASSVVDLAAERHRRERAEEG